MKEKRSVSYGEIEFDYMREWIELEGGSEEVVVLDKGASCENFLRLKLTESSSDEGRSCRRND